MRKVKSFLHVFENSLFPTSSYYKKVFLRTPLNFSFKYFLSLIILLNFIFLLSLGWRFNPQKISNILSSLTSAFEKYPEDLVINIKNGLAFTNYNHPYFLWLDYQNKKKLLFVVDETALPEKIQTYKSFGLLTSREIVLNLNQTKNQTFSTLPLNYISNQTITKEKISLFTMFLKRLVKNFFLIYIILTLTVAVAVFLFSLLINLFYITTAAFIVFFSYRLILKRKTHFKKIFQVGLHAVTLPFVIDYFTVISKPALNLKFNLPSSELLFPVSFLILLSIFTFAGIYTAHSPKDGKI